MTSELFQKGLLSKEKNLLMEEKIFSSNVEENYCIISGVSVCGGIRGSRGVGLCKMFKVFMLKFYIRWSRGSQASCAVHGQVLFPLKS